MAIGPLQGINIVDLTSVVVGPLCTQILADHGAEVIKVEALKGDLARNLNGKSPTPAMGAKFLHLNRNKRSITLDLKKPAGFEALKKIIARSDVMVWNVRPAAMARLKLAYEDVKTINPNIIYCGLFGFGEDGRYRGKPAFDGIIQAAAGMSGLFERAGDRPRNVPLVAADKVVGLIAVQMICMALIQRARTGEGCSIEIPMFENFTKFVMEEHMYLQTFQPPLGGTGDPRLLDPRAGPIATKDGYICITATTDKQAFALYDAIGRPELKTDPRFINVSARFASAGEGYKIRAEAFKAKTTDEWLAILERNDIPAMRMNTPDTIFDDPHLKDIGFFQVKEHPTEGPIRQMRLPNKWSTKLRDDWQPAPKIGQHSVDILREIGVPQSDIDAMIQDGATSDGRLKR
ncbi:MAG: CoA transferase [Betaproteobacteria bacterium]|nr:CoA transferase [Betaproteobacteria bacterium]